MSVQVEVLVELGANQAEKSGTANKYGPLAALESVKYAPACLSAVPRNETMYDCPLPTFKCNHMQMFIAICERATEQAHYTLIPSYSGFYMQMQACTTNLLYSLHRIFCQQALTLLVQGSHAPPDPVQKRRQAAD